MAIAASWPAQLCAQCVLPRERGGGRAVVHARSRVEGVDPSSGRVRWERSFSSSDGRVEHMIEPSGAPVAVVLLEGGRWRVRGEREGRLMGLDAATGAVLWEAWLSTEPGWGGSALLELGDRLFVWTGGRARVLDARTGAIVWERRMRAPETWGPGQGGIAVSPRIIAIGLGDFPGRLVLLDAPTGAVLADRAAPGPRSRERDQTAGLAVADEETFAVLPARVRGLPAQRVVAFDARGRVRWSTTPWVEAEHPAIGRGVPAFQIERDTVHVLMADGMLRAIDRSNGRVRWELEVGVDGGFAVRADGWVHACTGNGEAITQTAAELAAPPRRVRVFGRVLMEGPGRRGRRWVQIGSALARTDAQGGFSATIAARRAVRVVAFPVDPWSDELPEPVVVLLDGRDVYEVYPTIDGCGTRCWE